MNFFRGRRPSPRAEELNEEMRFHVDMEAADLEQMGASPDEARRRALATFGGVRRYAEEVGDTRDANWIEDLKRDVRYSLRSLARSPGYTAVVVLTLAFGIAANTSIFSVANGILFKPLPYRDPSRLMMLWDGLDWMGVPEANITGPEVAQLRNELKAFDGVAAVSAGDVTIGGDHGDPQQVPRLSVSANFFHLLGAGPDIGRGFGAGDDRVGAPRVAVLSRRLFTQRLGGDRAMLGTSIVIDGKPTTIIGVLPSGFRFTPQRSLASSKGDPDVYTPLADTLDRMQRGAHSITALARVRADVTVPAALAELGAAGKRLDDGLYEKRGFKFVPIVLQERMVREVRPALFALLGAVAMLILIMCANLAVLALVRAARREHEITVRRAIGASQSRVARQILTETVMLALGGAIIGTTLGVWTLRGLLAIAPRGLPRRDDIGIDLTVLAITLGVALIVGLGMGLAPVLQATRGDIASVLREKSSSRTRGRVRRALVLAQLALSMMLLAGTGLLLGSFVRLMGVDPGFDPRNVLTIEMMASRAQYATGQPVVNYFARQVDAIRALPGVTAAAATSATPLSAGADQSGVEFPSSTTNTGARDHDILLADIAPATAGYFRALAIPLVEGREFDSSQHDSATSRVAVIDDVLAVKFFPKGGAVGQIIEIEGDSLRIVGVSRHVRMYGLENAGRPQVWVPHAQTPYRQLTIAVRTTGEPLALAADVRRAIHDIDPNQAIAKVGTMSNVVDASLAQRKLVLLLVGMFAGAALLLVALGIYGITASSVALRTREIGIRVALGANRGRVMRSVLGEPARLVALGLATGLAGTY
ncbi:MAG TPA: ABC transporter permease, partial [Gemmatimonadaceae bacterium]|nr:ABC transporter permease [Gemmatimonadaceae bacterium]